MFFLGFCSAAGGITALLMILFFHLAELYEVFLDFLVKLLNLILVHFLGGLLALNIIHSHLIVFFQHLQLGLNRFALLHKIILSLEKLCWLLLELCEDH